MKRLERIKAALGELNTHGKDDVLPLAHPHINRSVLMDAADCLQFICFPEFCNAPSRLHTAITDRESEMEFVLGHLSDILTNQIYFAFILHSNEEAVADATSFKPLKAGQRSLLNWDVGHGDLKLREKGCDECEEEVVVPSSGGFLPPRQPAVKMPFIDQLFLRRCKAKAEAIVTKFLVDRLPHVRWLLHTDVEAIFQGDVAATSPSEVVLCYPGIRCMLHQRTAHELYLLGVPTNFTRMLTEIAHALTGIDIHPNTTIGHHFFMDHGTGIVIGATAIIGNHVSIYQGVSLGARSFPVDKKTGKKILDLPRHPIIEDGVTLYANAVVLGRVTIGRNSTIGGNCWIVRNVPPNSSIVQKSGHVLSANERMFFAGGDNDGSGI